MCFVTFQRRSFIDTFTVNSNLDMPTLWLLCQLSEDANDFIFKQDGVLPYFHICLETWMHIYPVDELVVEKPMTHVLQMETEITRINTMWLLFAGLCNRECSSHLPRCLPELRQQNRSVIVSTTRNKVWDELHHRQCGLQSTYPTFWVACKTHSLSIDWCWY